MPSPAAVVEPILLRSVLTKVWSEIEYKILRRSKKGSEHSEELRQTKAFQNSNSGNDSKSGDYSGLLYSSISKKQPYHSNGMELLLILFNLAMTFRTFWTS